MVTKLLSRLFPFEDLGIGSRYIERWVLFRGKHLSGYLHRLVGDDWARDPHDHPARFWSIGLWGSYIEETEFETRTFRAPWIRTFPATYLHRLRHTGKPCWTLVFVGRRTRNWGFVRDGEWIGQETYIAAAKSATHPTSPETSTS